MMPPAASEDQIHIAILEYLRAVLPNALIFHIPNDGVRTPAAAGRLIKLGMMAGAADLIIHTAQRETIYFEVKTAKGIHRANQIAFAGHCTSVGIPYALVRSVEDARAALSALNIKTRESNNETGCIS
jgi:hypothetical protein